MKSKIFGSVELEFTDDEIRSFLIDQGYKIEWGKTMVNDFPVGLKEIECEVAYKGDNQKSWQSVPQEGTYPSDYLSVFKLRINHFSPNFMETLSKLEVVKKELKDIILNFS